jgi:hypothetical protein
MELPLELCTVVFGQDAELVSTAVNGPVVVVVLNTTLPSHALKQVGCMMVSCTKFCECDAVVKNSPSAKSKSLFMLSI